MQDATRLSVKDRFQGVVDRQTMKFRLNMCPSDSRSPHIALRVETSRFTVKIAETYEEIRQVLKLRYQIFFEEQLQKTSPIQLDIDRYDKICDHLIIVDHESGRIVGTYRLLLSDRVETFYSESEFDLAGLLKLPGRKIELGRACIHPDFRKGTVMTLLWRGLSDYMRLAGAHYLFGCSSVKGEDPLWAALILRRLQESGQWRGDLGVRPKSIFMNQDIETYSDALSKSGATFHARFDQEIFPALLKGYLRAGAKICGIPAYDKDFHCFDFLTLLETSHITESYREKFGLPTVGGL